MEKTPKSTETHSSKKNTLLVIGAFILLVVLSQAPRIKTAVEGYALQFAPVKAGEIGIGQLKVELAAKKVMLINVQTPYEGEIPATSMLLSNADLAKYPKLLPSTKSDPIVLYDKDMTQTPAALSTVKGAGYTNVRVLAGGMDTWQKT